VTESIVAIGCLDGLLQFSQIYFSIKAIRELFASVPENSLLLIAIPLLFYAVNGLEQLGSILFSRYNARPSRAETLKRRQFASLLTLVVAVSLFTLCAVAVYFSGMDRLLHVVTFALFNVIKGFAGGLSEEWNEAIVRRHPQHDEARFTTLSALWGRFYQIAAVVCFLVLNGFANSSNWRNMKFMSRYDGNKETVLFVAALTACIFLIMASNFLAFLWLGRGKHQQVSVWPVLKDAVVKREERTALFTQLLRLLFFVSLILANLLSLKAASYKGLFFTHGSICYITVFVLINLITVFEDVEAAIKTVFLGMVAYVAVYAALLLSAAAGGQLMLEDKLLTLETYNSLLGRIADLYAASFYAYLVTAILSVGLLAAVSAYFGKRSPIYLGAGVTFICQAIDTVIYILVGYGRANVDLPSLIMGQYLVKFSVYLLMYFPLYCIIQGCRKWIGLERPRVKRPSLDKVIGESVESFNKARFLSR
ncbi:MAG TPA: VUT family protein, partial [Pyrinomonadaceae bacterium]|nr:VUT family protein [Pyrinomonadaceae bacterium]